MARIYRQAPLNAIWEGSGNVICLDVLRALKREPESAAALLGEFDAAAAEAASSGDARLATAGERLASLSASLTDELQRAAAASPTASLESGARRFVDCLGLALQASALIRGADATVATAFCESRLGPREQCVPFLAIPIPNCLIACSQLFRPAI